MTKGMKEGKTAEGRDSKWTAGRDVLLHSTPSHGLISPHTTYVQSLANQPHPSPLVQLLNSQRMAEAEGSIY